VERSGYWWRECREVSEGIEGLWGGWERDTGPVGVEGVWRLGKRERTCGEARNGVWGLLLGQKRGGESVRRSGNEVEGL